MSSTQPRDPTDVESLRTALESVLTAAHRNGVDVTGVFGCHPPDRGVGWDVEVVRVEPSDSD